MKTRTLGTTNLHVSELGFGAMSLKNTPKENAQIIDCAIDAGITLFDTADLYDYGKNEESVGTLLKKNRQKVILSTKVGNEWRSDNSWTWNPSKNYILQEVKESLRRLQTDYIDLYQLHGGTMEDPFEESIEAFEQLKKEGLIREYGISSIRPAVIQRFLQHSEACSVMMNYNLGDRRPEEWFSLIERASASVITRGTLNKGIFTEKGAYKLASHTSEEEKEHFFQILEDLQNNQLSAHATAIAFNLQSPIVASALVGASSVEQLEKSIEAYYNAPSQQELIALTKKLPQHTYVAHRPTQ